MRATDAIGWGTRGIRQRKMRAALTVLGIMIGVASVIALVSQTQGIQYSIVEQISMLGPTTITVRAGSNAVTLTQADVDRISQMPGVESAIPLVMSSVEVYGSGSSKMFSLIGVEPAQLDLIVEGITLQEGRMYQATSYSEIVVGSEVQNPQDMTSSFINVGQSTTVEVGLIDPIRKQVQIVGSMNPYGTSSLVSVDESIFMSLKGAMSVLQTTSYTSIIVKATDVDSVDGVVSNIKAAYGTRLGMFTIKQITQVVSSIIDQLTLLLGAIAAISLLVAGLGIMNIMFVSVIERTREIGVLKALGFKAKNIMIIFLTEAAMMGIIGGLLGVALGVVLSYMMPVVLNSAFTSSTAASTDISTSGSAGFGSVASSFSYSPIVSPEIVVFVILFALVVSIFAGYYPARRAAKMDPVVALRHD